MLAFVAPIYNSFHHVIYNRYTLHPECLKFSSKQQEVYSNICEVYRISTCKVRKGEYGILKTIIMNACMC